MTTQAPPLAWCGRCGKPATFRAASIDSRYPLVECGELLDSGAHTGCGTGPGVVDGALASDLRITRHRSFVMRAHPAHVKRGMPAQDCPICESDPPRPNETGHGFAELVDRRQLVKHLILDHGMRVDFTNERTYPVETLRAIHAGRSHVS